MKTPSQKRSDTVNAVSHVEIACPQCAYRYRVAAHLTGRRFQCRRCKHVWRWDRSGVMPQDIDLEAGSGSRMEGSGGIPTAGVAGSSVIDTSWAGRTLGRYRLDSILGRGGMGVVWRAHDPTLNRDVAIKILNQSASRSSPNSLSQQLFLQEARAAAKLNHPGAVTVFEIAEEQGYHFIAMELMREGTLKDRVDREGPIEPRELFALMAPPARALALAHERGIVHRDIKPGNLMFDDLGHLKLGDFGLSDVAGDPASVRMRGRSVGSLGWIAPETARGETTTPTSDIYAFGLVLLYALTGSPWLHAESRNKLLTLHQDPPEPDFASIPELSDDGKALLTRCLAKDPADRFQNADDLATFLEHCADEPEQTPIVLQADASAGRRMALVASALTAVAMAIAAAAFIWYYLDLSQARMSRPLKSLSPPAQLPEESPGRPARTATPPPAEASTRRPAPAAQGPRADGSDAEADQRQPWFGQVPAESLHFIASKNGRVYHLPTCEGGRKIYLANLTDYPTAEAAEAAGKAPCPDCLSPAGEKTAQKPAERD